jgi:SAM-dependent methyltransferase
MAFEDLKQRQSVIWGNGRFELVSETASDVHDAVVAELAPAAGERWLDLACGTGAIPERAAAAGASVVGVDLAPKLIETAKRRAAERRLEIDYRVGDCERLEGIGDASFDVVSSTFGVIFAPDHRAVAGELARVARPGGRLALTTWTPDGGIGELLKLTASFQPPPPPGAGSPLDWGRPEYVRELLSNAFDLEIDQHVSVYRSESGEATWEFFTANFGPTKSLVESLDEERRAELRRTWIDFFESNYRVNGSIEQPREYLLVLGARR